MLVRRFLDEHHKFRNHCQPCRQETYALKLCTLGIARMAESLPSLEAPVVNERPGDNILDISGANCGKLETNVLVNSDNVYFMEYILCDLLPV